MKTSFAQRLRLKRAALAFAKRSFNCFARDSPWSKVFVASSRSNALSRLNFARKISSSSPIVSSPFIALVANNSRVYSSTYARRASLASLVTMSTTRLRFPFVAAASFARAHTSARSFATSGAYNEVEGSSGHAETSFPSPAPRPPRPPRAGAACPLLSSTFCCLARMDDDLAAATVAVVVVAAPALARATA
eukprot:CAMPEP_0179720044 /NCGR_PEP_ID=MMETSP0938-20121108/3744_1 /TAXON_ID=548131 ORGANISM="Ostreococcus mediterraneus, Strain clade-D-RCC1107" /NCGR_SAMPLE_ID=MMETSP0938 /ASSEMBLY_ACC=CAM_ASM_000576 /LENGTH=191 /DNA_ID=CAMNT_0021593911 /DNA_START=331 /DNA_END=904 /DNA_ORIENTATION=-